MNRLTRQVQADRCDRCRADVLTSNWDDYEFQTVEIVADPTPLDIDLQAVCIITDRPVFTLDRVMARSYRMTRRHAWNTKYAAPWTVAVIPAHQCGARLPGRLDDTTDADLHPRPAAPVTEPSW